MIDNKLAYSIKNVNTVKMVYDLRFEMFRAIYNHKVAQAIDLMMRDALVAADGHFNFLQNLRNPGIYRNYTDSIVKRIERSPDPKLKDSQAILNRLHCRDIYKYVDGLWLENKDEMKRFKEQDLADLSDGVFTAEDVVFKPTVFDHGCKGQFPLGGTNSEGIKQKSLINFYRNCQDLEIIDSINHIEYGIAKPKRIRECWIRLFVKDAKYQQKARETFRKYCRQVYRTQNMDSVQDEKTLQELEEKE